MPIVADDRLFLDFSRAPYLEGELDVARVR